MLLPLRNIWDSRVQSVCAIISAQSGESVELWMCGNFSQVSLQPPRLAINPNALYPIEAAIRNTARFAVNIYAEGNEEVLQQMMHVRRREPNKAEALGIPVELDSTHKIPYLPGALQTLFCDLEQPLETGDHTLMIARVVGVRHNPAQAGRMPALYPQTLAAPVELPWPFRPLMQKARQMVGSLGLANFIKKRILRRHAGEPDLQAETYEQGGQTTEEVRQIVSQGVSDIGRKVAPPFNPPAPLRKKLRVCVVGIGQWGAMHCRLFRQADPMVELYVCAQNRERLERMGRQVGATDVIVGLDRALKDPRIDAVSLALPHHLHASAVLQAVAAGKHVLVEKPIATSVDDASAMVNAAARAGVILMVAEDMHFRPAISECVRAISRGDIGEPLYMKVHAGGMWRPRGWRADAHLMGGGVMLDIGVHYVRALRLLMGEPDRAFASRAMQVDTKISGEDSVQAIFSSALGWQAHFLLSWASPRGHSPDIVVSGDKGVLHLWPRSAFYDYMPPEPPFWMQCASHLRPARLAEFFQRPAWQQQRRHFRTPDATGYLAQVREFLAAVSEKRPPVSDPVDAVRDLEIVTKAYEALNTQAWVQIPDYDHLTPKRRGVLV